MEQQDALVDAIRAIIGPRDISSERILSLLALADNNPNKVVDLFFHTETENGAIQTTNDVEGSDEEDGDGMNWTESPVLSNNPLTEETDTTGANRAKWTSQAEELSGLLGGEVDREIILSLLSSAGNDLNKAVEIYFSEAGAEARFEENDEAEEEVTNKIELPRNVFMSRMENEKYSPPSSASSKTTFSPLDETVQLLLHSPSASPQSVPALTPVDLPQLAPFSLAVVPTSPAEDRRVATSALIRRSEEELLYGPETYEVIMSNSNFCWEICNISGRAVVQQVQPLGPAAAAGIQKSDVLLFFRDTVITKENCAAVVQQLLEERVTIPSVLRFRRVSSFAATATSSPAQDSDGDIVMASANTDASTFLESVDPKYGLQVLCKAVESMQDAVAGPATVELKVLVDLLLKSDFNLDRAVNMFLTEDRIVSDFRGIVGSEWNIDQPNATVMESYAASIPAGPLGLTVENILERTIVVDIKSGGAAERANVKRSSWLVGLNGQRVTHLTHKETLRLIETAIRPLQLQLVLIPPKDYKALRRQLSMNIRQQKTERPIPEQDRMSFRVFQLKIHQGVLVFPKIVTKALFHYLSTEEYHPPTTNSQYPNPLERLLPENEYWDAAVLKDILAMEEERVGEMCAERRFLLNLFASVHDYDDKGESIVIRTIQFLGWLAVRSANMHNIVKAKESQSSNGSGGSIRCRYELLLAVLLHILESLSIIENHATWDVMVNALKMLILSLSKDDINKLLVPMLSRLSVSSSPTARIVPVALLSMVYPHVHGDVPVQLRGMLDRMCNDDNPLVRRAVTSIIGDLAAAGGSSLASWTVQLLEKSTADSHDIVRIFAVKCCIILANTLRCQFSKDQNKSQEETEHELRLLYCQIMPMVNTYTSDSSWQVRLETARTLPALCRAFGAEYTDVFVDHFVSMVGDPTVEVRRACAVGSFYLGEALRDIASQQMPASKSNCQELNQPNPEFADNNSHFLIAAQFKFVRSILPATYTLSTDVSMAVRLSLARSVGRSLQYVSSVYYDELVPIFTQFLDGSQEATVRASLLEEMARYCDSSSDTVIAMIFPAIEALKTSINWRVRVKFVHCVAAWAEREDGATLPGAFADACLELLGDTVNEVRSVVCEALTPLGKSLGSEWMLEKCVPRVLLCLQSTFRGRLTGLLAIELIASELQEMDRLRDTIDMVLEQCKSMTANLRFRALRTLGQIVPRLNDPVTTKSILEFVRPLTLVDTEADPDVREAAENTQKLLETVLI
ncbi:hypothetical protein CCR75_009562 [Bremia lactucae]|uniref:PDZ domain-containing protein n=1 Tax=Bremia lactucae TaxID=4779 RepID=A0A976FQ47_BRELC|nr:hypothetical protein CCR75_009562 [Bremia lactucae]